MPQWLEEGDGARKQERLQAVMKLLEDKVITPLSGSLPPSGFFLYLLVVLLHRGPRQMMQKASCRCSCILPSALMLCLSGGVMPQPDA